MGAKEEKDENAVEGEKNAKEASVKPKGMIEESGERRNEKNKNQILVAKDDTLAAAPLAHVRPDGGTIGSP